MGGLAGNWCSRNGDGYCICIVTFFIDIHQCLEQLKTNYNTRLRSYLILSTIIILVLHVIHRKCTCTYDQILKSEILSRTKNHYLPSATFFFASPLASSPPCTLPPPWESAKKSERGRKRVLGENNCVTASAAQLLLLQRFQRLKSTHWLGAARLFFFCMRASVRFFLSLAPRWLNFFAMRAAAAVAVLLA